MAKFFPCFSINVIVLAIFWQAAWYGRIFLPLEVKELKFKIPFKSQKKSAFQQERYEILELHGCWLPVDRRNTANTENIHYTAG